MFVLVGFFLISCEEPKEEIVNRFELPDSNRVVTIQENSQNSAQNTNNEQNSNNNQNANNQEEKTREELLFEQATTSSVPEIFTLASKTTTKVNNTVIEESANEYKDGEQYKRSVSYVNPETNKQEKFDVFFLDQYYECFYESSWSCVKFPQDFFEEIQGQEQNTNQADIKQKSSDETSKPTIEIRPDRRIANKDTSCFRILYEKNVKEDVCFFEGIVFSSTFSSNEETISYVVTSFSNTVASNAFVLPATPTLIQEN